MKRWKLCLALVLALTMLFSLALTAQAEGEMTYTDSRKITQTMPATILSGLGIVNGYPDNTFRPYAPISRAEFCKILARLDHSGKEPAADYTAALPAGDKTDASLKNSVGYCISMGYAFGDNGEAFDPNGKITLLEAARMLLLALGHNAEVEGFVGENWKDNVRVEAHRERSRLFNNLPEEVLTNLEGELTRDYACRMFYNALIANVVSVPTGNTTTVGDITIQDKFNVQFVANEKFDYLNRAVDKNLQLVERLYPNLRAASDAADEFGRPTEYWVDGTKKIGPFIFRDPLIKGAGNITGKSAKAKILDDPTSLEFYLNGKLNSSADIGTVATLLGMPDVDAPHFLREHDRSYCGRLSSSYAASMLAVIWRNSTYRLGKCNSSGSVTGTANRVCTTGMYSELFYNPDTGRATVCASGLYPAKVNKYIPAKYDENGVEIVPAYVSATIVGGGTISPLADLKLTDTVMATKTSATNVLFLASADEKSQSYTAGEVVLLTFGYDNELGGHIVYHAYRTNKISGTVSGPLTYSSAKATTVNGFYMNGGKTKYTPARKNSYFPLKKFNIGDSYTIYTGVLTSTSGKATGSTLAFYAEATNQEESSRVVYVKNAGVETDLFGEHTYRAQLVNDRGEIIEVVTDQNYGRLVDCLASFTIDANEKYSLLKVGSSGLGSFTVKQGNAKMTLTPAKATSISIRGEQDLDYARERTVVADDNTLFLIGTRADETEDIIYTAYRGIKNVPDADSTPYYNFAELNGVATTVFIYETKSDIAASSYGMLFKTDKDLFSTYTVGSSGYYEMQAVINDEAKTVKVTPKVYESLKYGINLFSGCSTNLEGWLSSVSLLNSKYTYPITALEPTDKGVLHMNFDENGNGGIRYVTHDDLHVYAYSLRDRKTSVISTDLLYELGATENATELFGANASAIKKGYYTLHETYEGKPLAGIFVIVD